MKRNSLIGFASAGIAAAVLCLGGLGGEPAWAFKKGSDPVTVVYDPQANSSILKTTAVGQAPAGARHNAAQRRLLAKRAATVAAYRNLLKASAEIRPLIGAGAFVEEVSGYLQGAQTTEVRYFEDGRAEVEMVLPLGQVARDFEETTVIFSKSRIPVCEIVREKKVLTKEEYEQLFSK